MVDSNTESKIVDSFKEIFKNKTTIIIAHRLSSIIHADNIIVLSNGQVVEQGTHSQLLEKNGFYHELWNAQANSNKHK